MTMKIARICLVVADRYHSDLLKLENVHGFLFFHYNASSFPEDSKVQVVSLGDSSLWDRTVDRPWIIAH